MITFQLRAPDAKQLRYWHCRCVIEVSRSVTRCDLAGCTFKRRLTPVCSVCVTKLHHAKATS